MRASGAVSLRTLLGFVLAALILVYASLGCGGINCDQLRQAAEIACAADPHGEACRAATEALKKCPAPTPPPVTQPTAPPTTPLW